MLAVLILLGKHGTLNDVFGDVETEQVSHDVRIKKGIANAETLQQDHTEHFC